MMQNLLVQSHMVQHCAKCKSSRLTAGTARTANLKTSCPLMTMFVKDPSAEAPAAFKGFKPS